MKVLLIRPNFKGMGNYVPPHMGIAYLSRAIKNKFKNNVDIVLIDALSSKLNESEIVKKALDIAPDFILMTSKTMQMSTTNKIAELIKKKMNTIIIIGGNHVTVKPDDYIYSGNYIDYGVIGEGELTVVELISALEHKMPVEEIKGITFLKNKQLIINEKREFENNLDLLGFPDWSIFSLDDYNENIHINSFDKALPIMASRGCPFKCNFCSTYLTWGNSVRYKTVDFVINEILYNIENYGIRVFHFYDDNLLLNREWVIDFSNKIIQNKIDIEWICLSRSEFIIKNQDVLCLMKKAGCKGFELGFESGDTEAYKRMNKTLKIETFNTAFEILMKNEFEMIELLLMNFYIGETVESMYASNQRVLSLKNMVKNTPTTVLVSRYFATPFPGTDFYSEAQDKGIFLHSGTEYSYAIFKTFIPNSFIESSVDSLSLEINRIKIHYDFNYSKYNLIYKNIIDKILEDYNFTDILNFLNELFKKHKKIEDVFQSLFNEFDNKYNKNAVIEFVCTILVMALEVDGLKYEKEEYIIC